MLHSRRIPFRRAVLLAALVGSLALSPPAPAQGKNFKDIMKFASEMARNGSWREAKFRWEQAERQNPESPQVLNNLAVAAEALGSFDDARGYYEKALGLAPADQHIQDNHRRFDRFWRQLNADKEGDDGTARERSRTPFPQKAKKKSKSKIDRVTVGLPVPPRLELRGDETVLVASFLDDETELLDINRELVRFLRSEFRKATSLEVLNIVPPPEVPEQTVADLLANTEFWKYLHREYGAELIVSGVLTYDRQDVSGFEDVDIVSPSTGQKVRQTRFVEREQFLYALEIFFIDGPTGTLRHRERLERGAIFKGAQNDPITAFYELSEVIAQDVLGVVISRQRRDTRVIFRS